MMSRHRLRLACGGLDIICASCYGAVKGEQSSPHCIKNANGGIKKKLLTEALISANIFYRKRCYRKATVRLS